MWKVIMSASSSWCLTRCLGHNSYSIDACWFVIEETGRELLELEQLGQLTIKIRIIKGMVNRRYLRRSHRQIYVQTAQRTSLQPWARSCVISAMCPMRTCASPCACCSTSPEWISVIFRRPGNQYSLATWKQACTLHLSDKWSLWCLCFSTSYTERIGFICNPQLLLLKYRKLYCTCQTFFNVII